MLGCGNSRLSEEARCPCHHQISATYHHPYMQMYDDGYKSITNVDVRHVHYTLLRRLTVSYSVLFRGHPPNATTPQHLATGNGMLVVVCVRMHEAHSFPEGVVADVRELPFDGGTFDVALDKGERIYTTLLHVSDSLFPRDDGRTNDSKRRRLGDYSRHCLPVLF